MDAISLTVQYLKDNFNSFSYEQKIQVKNVGRPKPELNLTQTTKGKSRDFTCTKKMIGFVGAVLVTVCFAENKNRRMDFTFKQCNTV